MKTAFSKLANDLNYLFQLNKSCFSFSFLHPDVLKLERSVSNLIALCFYLKSIRYITNLDCSLDGLAYQWTACSVYCSAFPHHPSHFSTTDYPG